MTSVATPSPALPQTDKNTNSAQSNINRLTDCHFYLTSFCKNGLSCEFRHNEDAKSMFKVCKYWLNDECDNVHCMFRHPTKIPKPSKADPSQTPCYFFFQGGGCAKGTACQFLHTKAGATAMESKKTPSATASTVEAATKNAALITPKQTPQIAKSETTSKAPSKKPEVTSSQKKNVEKPVEKKPAATVNESQKTEQKSEPKKEVKRKKINRDILATISLDGDEFSSVVFSSSSLTKRPREEEEPANAKTDSPAKKQRVDPPAVKPAAPAPAAKVAPKEATPKLAPAPVAKTPQPAPVTSKPAPKPAPAAVSTPVSKPAATTVNTTKPKPSTSTTKTPEPPKPAPKPVAAADPEADLSAELEELEAFLAEN